MRLSKILRILRFKKEDKRNWKQKLLKKKLKRNLWDIQRNKLHKIWLRERENKKRNMNNHSFY